MMVLPMSAETIAGPWTSVQLRWKATVTVRLAQNSSSASATRAAGTDAHALRKRYRAPECPRLTLRNVAAPAAGMLSLANERTNMPTRKPKSPELSKAVDSLNEAAQHVRNAVQGKIDQVRGAAATELAKAKAVARKQTSAAHAKLEAALNRAEARLHKVIAGAQKSLDKAVREADKRSAAMAKKAPAKKSPAKKATPADK